MHIRVFSYCPLRQLMTTYSVRILHTASNTLPYITKNIMTAYTHSISTPEIHNQRRKFYVQTSKKKKNEREQKKKKSLRRSARAKLVVLVAQRTMTQQLSRSAGCSRHRASPLNSPFLEVTFPIKILWCFTGHVPSPA